MKYIKNIYENSYSSLFLKKVFLLFENCFPRPFIIKKKEFLPPLFFENSFFWSKTTALINRIKPSIRWEALEYSVVFLFSLIFLFVPLKAWLKTAFPLGSLYTFVVPGLLILIALILFIRDTKNLKIKPSLLDLSLFFLILSLIVSSVLSYLKYGALINIFYDSFIWISYFAVFFIAKKIFVTKKQLLLFLYFNIFLVAVLSLYGISQYFFGLATPHWIESYELIKTRVFSTLDNPIILSGYINVFSFLTLALFFSVKKSYLKLLFLPAFALSSLALLLTFSRSGWIGLLAGLLLFFLVFNVRYILGMLSALVTSIIFLPKEIFYRFLAALGDQYQDISAVSGRIWTLNNVFHIFPNHLFFGVGPGMYGGEVAFKISPSIVYMEGIQGGVVPIANTDNSFLQVLIQQGLVGFFALLFFVAATMYCGLSTYHKLKDKTLKLLALGITASSLGLFVQAFLADVFQFPQLSLCLFAFLGILLSLPRIENTNLKEK